MLEPEQWQVSRRDLVKASAAGAAGAALVGVPALGAGSVAAQDVATVDRNRTLILRWGGREGRHIDAELWNGYALGANHQNGLGLMYEPLAFYSAFADEMIPWLAESWEYNDDFTELTIKTREGITWSDGVPFTAGDVAFTLNSLRDLGPVVRWGVDVQQFVEEATATSDTEVVVTFKVPAPRFFYFMTYKYDIGVYIVPQHVYEGQEWESFLAFDLEQGWPVTTGPWRVVFSSADQKVLDVAESWWAVDQGLVEAMPQVERIVYLPFTEETQVAQQIITNQVDTSLGLGALTMETLLMQNPAVITHSGQESPFGYVDWWPTSLYVNTQAEPFSDVNVRWALSYFIDRQQVIDVGQGGAGSMAPLPMPTYPGLIPYFENVADLLEEYPTLEFNPEKGAARLTESGWAKGDDGMWAKDGTTLSMKLESLALFNDIGPVIAEQLRQQGVNVEFSLPVDILDRFEQGNYEGTLFGHGGSVSGDPYYTLRLYQSQTEAVPGGHQVNFSRWDNPDYDAIVDQIAITPVEDQETLLGLWHDAMELWIPELPDIQIQEFYHRIPMNTTYWTGWPDRDNPYINGAFWHLTFQLILNRLAPAQ